MISVGWISAAHPPFRLQLVDALRLSTLRFIQKITVFTSRFSMSVVGVALATIVNQQKKDAKTIGKE